MIVLKILLNIVLLPFKIIIQILRWILGGINNKRRIRDLRNTDINKIDSLNGFEFERFVGEVFKAYGYKTRVTQKSGDYGADIIAYKAGRSYAVQTKMYFGHTVGNKAVQEAYTAKSYYNTDVAVVFCNSNFSKNAVITAENLDVVLIGREDMINIISKGFDLKKYSLINYLEK